MEAFSEHWDLFSFPSCHLWEGHNFSSLSLFAVSSNLDFSLADMVFHLSEYFLQNSAKLTEESGCFLLCSSRRVCTEKASEAVLPRGLLGSPLCMKLLQLRRRRRVHLEKDCPRGSATLLPRLWPELLRRSAIFFSRGSSQPRDRT